MSVELVFTSKGAQEVIANQNRIADGAKAASLLYKQENKELAQLGRDAQRVFNQTRTELEKLHAQADKLRAAVGNVNLPQAERDAAADALDRIEGKIKNIEEGAEDAGGAIDDAFGGAKSALLGSFATAAGAAAAAVAMTIKAVTDEMQAAQELADKAAVSQMTLSASRNVLLRNMGSATSDERRAALEATRSMADELGVSEQYINVGLAEASAAAMGNYDLALDSVRTSAKFLKDSPGEIAGYSASLLDINKSSGFDDALANFGVVAMIGEEARVPAQAELSKSSAQALLGGSEFGLSTQESAAIFQTLTGTMGDTTGRMTATATVQLAKQLSEFTGTAVDPAELAKAQEQLAAAVEAREDAEEGVLSARDRSADRDTPAQRSLRDARDRLERLVAQEARPDEIERQQEVVRRKEVDAERDQATRDRGVDRAERRLAKAEEQLAQSREQLAQMEQAARAGRDLTGMSTMEKFYAIQGDASLADAFLSNATFETKATGQVVGALTDPNSPTARGLARAMDIFGNLDLAGARQAGQKAIDAMRDNDLEPRAAAGRAISTGLENLRMRGDAELTTEQIGEIKETLQRAGDSSMGARVRILLEKLSDGKATVSVGEAATLLEQRATELERGRSANYGARGAPTRYNPATQSDLEVAETLRRMAEQLREQTDLMREGNAERKRNTDETKKAKGITGGAG